jgi:hypothetical protein
MSSDKCCSLTSARIGRGDDQYAGFFLLLRIRGAAVLGACAWIKKKRVWNRQGLGKTLAKTLAVWPENGT